VEPKTMFTSTADRLESDEQLQQDHVTIDPKRRVWPKEIDADDLLRLETARKRGCN